MESVREQTIRENSTFMQTENGFAKLNPSFKNNAFGSDLTNLPSEQSTSFCSDNQNSLKTSTNSIISHNQLDKLGSLHSCDNFETKHFPQPNTKSAHSKTQIYKSTQMQEELPVQSLFSNENPYDFIFEADLDPVDLEQLSDAQSVAFYAKEIFSNLLENDKNTNKWHHGKQQLQFTQLQPELSSTMRAILIDWLMDVHSTFALQSPTLFLAVHLIDQCIHLLEIPRELFQLVGVTCLFLASKFQEIYPPTLDDFLLTTNNFYTREEVLELEGKILLATGFDQLLVPTQIDFLSRLCQISQLSKRDTFLASYLCELSLLEFRMRCYSNSMIATASVYLVKKIRRCQNSWTNEIASAVQMEEAAVRACAKDLCHLMQNIETSGLSACQRKYQSDEFGQVAKIKILPKKEGNRMN